MSKQQTGLRIDRVLFRQFQQLCKAEKLRPGEAVESLVRLAVDNGGVASMATHTGHEMPGYALDEVLFRSRGIKVEGESRIGAKVLDRDWRRSSCAGIGRLVKELSELGRRS